MSNYRDTATHGVKVYYRNGKDYTFFVQSKDSVTFVADFVRIEIEPDRITWIPNASIIYFSMFPLTKKFDSSNSDSNGAADDYS